MKKKQAIAFLLSTTMAVGGAVQAFAAASDINGHWAEATIAKWQSVGKIGGYEDGTFKPDKTITRAEFVRLLNTATATSFTSSANISFSDVKESDWFFADVAKAVGSKITKAKKVKYNLPLIGANGILFLFFISASFLFKQTYNGSHKCVFTIFFFWFFCFIFIMNGIALFWDIYVLYLIRLRLYHAQFFCCNFFYSI